MGEKDGRCRTRVSGWTLLAEILGARGLPGEHDAALAALRAARAADRERLVGIAEGNLGLLADNRGRWPEALRRYRTAQRAFRRSGHVVHAANITENRASILVELGQLDQAIDELSDAARIFTAAGDDHRAAVTRSMAARARMRRDGDRTALAVIPLAITAAESHRDDEMAMFHWLGLAEALLLAGKARPAATITRRVMKSSSHLGAQHLVPITARRLAAVSAWRRGYHTHAERLLDDAFQRAEAGHVTPEIAAIAATTRIVRDRCGRGAGRRSPRRRHRRRRPPRRRVTAVVRADRYEGQRPRPVDAAARQPTSDRATVP